MKTTTQSLSSPHSSTKGATVYTRITRGILSLLLLVVAVATWGYMSWNIPFNNDEAVQFHTIACELFPNAQLHKFREGCGVKNLNVFGYSLPLRSYTYIGVSGALAFIPFWWIVAAPIALRIWTGFLWLASSVVLSRLLLVPWALVMTVVMLSTPVFAQHLIDTGPIAWQLLLLEFGVWLVVTALTCSSLWRIVLLGGLAGLCAFLAFEQKGFVVYGACFALYLFIVATFRRGLLRELGLRLGLLRFVTCGGAFALVSSALLGILLSAKTIEGGSYYTALQSATKNYSINELESWVSHFMTFIRDFILFPTRYFHRVYDVAGLVSRESDFFAVMCLSGVAAGAALLLAIERKWAYIGLLILSVFLAGGDLFLMARAQMAWAGHHVIFAHVIIFVGLAVALNALLPRYAVLVIGAIGLLLYEQVTPWQTLVNAKPQVESDPSRMELLEIVDTPNFASNYVVTHLSWGTYFIDALFGPRDQIVTWVESPEQPELEQIARSRQRRLAFFRFECSKSDPRSQLIWDEYAKRKGMALRATSSSGKWELWVEPEA